MQQWRARDSTTHVYLRVQGMASWSCREGSGTKHQTQAGQGALSPLPWGMGLCCGPLALGMAFLGKGKHSPTGLWGVPALGHGLHPHWGGFPPALQQAG